MFRSLFAACLISTLCAAPALAQEHQGHWFGEGEGELTLDLTHIQNDIYGMSINTVVPISDMGGGCAGENRRPSGGEEQGSRNERSTHEEYLGGRSCVVMR